MSLINEEKIELQSIQWFKEMGYNHINGFKIHPKERNLKEMISEKYILKKD